MGLAIIKTRTTLGIQALSVSVEVHLSSGLPAFSIVGLAETIVKESKERVRSAIINSRFEFPLKRITVNLGPAHLPKSGNGFDLAIAIGILAASKQIPALQLDTYEFVAELALDGRLRGVNPIIPIALAVKQDNSSLIIANANIDEVGLVRYSNILAADSLCSICSYFCQQNPLAAVNVDHTPAIAFAHQIDWAEVKGQLHAKKALEIAACGGHSVLLSGPPGSGKTMLAKRFITLLPPLSEEQALETASIYSLRGKTPHYSQWHIPPFRAPHHSVSHMGLIGGGNPPKPGEISLAHHGVLFLDELPEFQRYTLETLREPLESGTISISRASVQVDYPAKFQLIAAMNPCPCGQQGYENCTCPTDKIRRYLAKLSAPILDRIDMQIVVIPLSEDELLQMESIKNPTSEMIRQKVSEVHAYQIKRQGVLNAHLNAQDCEQVCLLGGEEQVLLRHILLRLKLSARGFHRLLKVARTIADLNFQTKVTCNDLKQALSYKQKIGEEIEIHF